MQEYAKLYKNFTSVPAWLIAKEIYLKTNTKYQWGILAIAILSALVFMVSVVTDYSNRAVYSLVSVLAYTLLFFIFLKAKAEYTKTLAIDDPTGLAFGHGYQDIRFKKFFEMSANDNLINHFDKAIEVAQSRRESGPKRSSLSDPFILFLMATTVAIVIAYKIELNNIFDVNIIYILLLICSLFLTVIVTWISLFFKIMNENSLYEFEVFLKCGIVKNRAIEELVPE